ncbi:MAG TPA: GNAT family N-acetyltransferase [Xanthobacteraceae bacterium]|nr:GNAT family N-acetyltransferase [Xanthobacteraceae bacterium]
MDSIAPRDSGARTLGLADVERVIAIDRAHTGQSRRRFFEKRFAAAAARPQDFVPIGIDREGTLRGFAIARILRGEFGREQAVAVLDAVGVEPDSRQRGVGRALMDELIAALDRMGVRSLHSQAAWDNHELVRFFAASGFALAPRLVLERFVAEPLYEASEEV